MSRSLVGLPAEKVLEWTEGYIIRRNLKPLSANRLLQEAMREQGRYAVVTKTKIRRAASRLIARGEDL